MYVPRAVEKRGGGGKPRVQRQPGGVRIQARKILQYSGTSILYASSDFANLPTLGSIYGREVRYYLLPGILSR